MSNRDGLREHFSVNVENSVTEQISTLYCHVTCTMEAVANFRARIKGTDWKFIVPTMTNLSNGRTLKITGVTKKEISTL